MELPERVYFDYDDEMKLDDVVEVIPATEISVDFTYPLTNPASFVIQGPFTLSTLKEKIMEIYELIYKKEEQTATGGIGFIDGTYNRKKTFGKYGIWGHGLGDLFLEQMYRIENNRYGLHVGS